MRAEGSAAGDRAALVALYNATDGPNWVDNTNWLTDQPLSQWKGVRTQEGRVRGLWFFANGLSGRLPIELGKLTRLTQLALAGNDLSGPIPAELGNLTELSSLFLDRNDLSGPIPAELGKLTRLTQLALGGNDLSGPIPAELGNLTELFNLSLDGNDLSGPIPAELGKLTRLTSLTLFGNDLSGRIPAELGNLTRLGTLWLHRNELSGAFPPELATLSRLTTLLLNENAGLAGTLPEALRNMSALRSLAVEGTRLCAPRDAPFQEWLKTIKFSGFNCPSESITDSQTVIDVAVFYTPASVREYRRPYGYQQFRALVDLMFAEANHALEASGVNVVFSLVGLEEVTYVEQGGSLGVFNNFANDSDGEMDEIHDNRDRLGADIAVLLANGVRGRAFLGGGASNAFAMVGNLEGGEFTHELGHVMGVAHDRYTVMHRDCAIPGSCARGFVPAYGYGYVNQRAFDESADTSAPWRTVMAYIGQCAKAGITCPRVMRFSNPDQQFRGDPLGIAGDRETVAVDGPADAARTMNERRETVASFRTRPEGLDPSAVTVSFDPPQITVAEGESATLKVRLSRALGRTVTVSLSHGTGQFAGGSEGADYSALPATVTFGSNQTEAPIEIRAIDDSLVEGAEGVVLEISEANLPWGLIIGSNPAATVSIQDNDLPPAPVVTTGRALVVEEGQTAVATLAATDTDTPAARLTWSIPTSSAGGTDGHLFALSAAGQLAFSAAKDYESPDDADQDGTYEVTVQVTDGQTPVTAAIQVRLLNRNEAPTADAGADQSNVVEGASVTLAGSGTDPDADDTPGTLQFRWRQTDTGPHRVTLSNSNAESATFTAPTGLTADAVLRFALTVTDDGSLSAEDEVEVTVSREPANAPNVLFISIDDLNDWIEPLGGHPQAQTPNLARLARRSTLFTHAYAAAPYCNPSRAALLGGIAPYRSGIYTNGKNWVNALKNVVTLPQAFKQGGYWTARSGKVFHHSQGGSSLWDDRWPEGRGRPPDPRPKRGSRDGIPGSGNIQWGPLDIDTSQMSDAKVAAWVAAELRKSRDKPFFLACGIFQPHLQWHVPRKYFDRFPLDSIELPVIRENDLADVPAAGLRMAMPDGDHASAVRHEKWQRAVQAYLASVNFADDMVGTLLDALDQSGRADDTIVVLFGDHGFHLGEKQHWKKGTLWEEATRVPLMISVPAGTAGLQAGTPASGSVSSRPVSLLDIFPTLLELAGLEPTAVLGAGQSLDGRSLVPLLRDPKQTWQPAVMTHGEMNHAVRSEDFRYIRYADGSEELYDHRTDPMEWTNLASDARFRDEKSRLRKHLPATNAPGPARVTAYPTEISVANGSAQTYSLVLDSKPDRSVTVTVKMPDLSGTDLSVRASPDRLTFTPENWYDAQDVTLSVASNAAAIPEDPVKLRHTVRGGRYDGANGPVVAVRAIEGTGVSKALSVQFGAAAYTAAEGGAAAAVTVSLSAAPGREVTIPLAHAPVNGAEAADYSGVPASVTFSKEETSKTFSVTANDDRVDEASEAVDLGFGSLPAGVTAGGRSTARVGLVDDDAATFTVSTDAAAIAEGESATLTVAISNGVTFAEDQTISLAASGTASASDYTGLPSTLTLAAAASSVTATLAASADQEEEAAETVTVTASHGGSTIGSTTLTINSISRDATLAALSLSGIDIGTFSEAVTSYQASVVNSVTSTTVTATASHSGASVSIDPGAEVDLAEGANQITVTVTAEDGTTTETYTMTVTRAALPTATIAAGTTPVTEGTAATYTVTLDPAAPEALTVAVTVTESGSALSGTPPASVAFAKGATSASLSVPTIGDSIVEAHSTVTATVTAGTAYTVGSTSSASVTVQDDDAATFTVSTDAAAIAEGESATLTVAISNGVTFAEDQTISLAASGTASTSDYTGLPSTLTLAAGASSVTATLAASADQEEEAAETVTVTASHGGSTIGSATVTINSISRDATLAALSLSGVDIGTFSKAVTSYQASVANSVTATTVTATATHSGATVRIEPGSQVTLAEGANQITVTVTAEDGTTTGTYTITVTRAALPTATIAAGTTPVTEGTAATYTVTLDPAAPAALTVAVSVTESGSALSGTPPMSVAFAKGATRATLSVPTIGDSIVEAHSTVTATVTVGTGYTVGSTSSATVTVEDDDAATFTVSAAPEAIAEGESATLTVAISNGVTFAEAQTISLVASGTASTSDYTGLPSTLTLAAGAASITATLAASADQEEEDAETVTVTASHGGSAIGSATVTINSISRDATLATLSLSGVDIGTFSRSVTSYQASVANSVTSTTVTATASHSGARVSIDPGSRVTLAEGVNRITVTVTAGDGTTRKTYTVTVTRAALPVVSIAAVKERARGPIGEVTASRTGPTTEPLEVQVQMTNTRTTETRTLTFRFVSGQSTMTRQAQAGDNKVVEDDITVTWTLLDGEGYTVSDQRGSASVVLEESDVPEFSVTVEPNDIAEGESATVTVAITNGVTFAEEQTISLATSGTASGSDYSGVPRTVTLYAYRSSARTATLKAAVDREEEDAETVTVTASHGGATIGSATVTINSVSDDATLSALSLSGIDIGTFSGAATSYQARVEQSVQTTTVTATANHSEAKVSIDPGSEVSLAEGANRITITVTAESGTRKTYTVTVTRVALPVVSIATVEERARGASGEVTASRTGTTAEPLEVQVQITSTSTAEIVPVTFRFRPGQRSVTRQVQARENQIVEDDITVTWTLQEGEGYTVSEEHASASVVLEEIDVPEFSVTVKPGKIREGESATVKVATTNGVTFSEDQTISLATSGTASSSEYTGLPPTLTLAAGTSSVTATLAASADQEEEDAETVTVTALHEGSEIGSATVTIAASESPLPLTAEFAGMPATHDGETEFTFQLRFSEKIKIRNEKLRDAALEVTGGTVRGVRRVRSPPPHLNRRWIITVAPASDADVVVTLPVTADCKARGAVCTPGGKGLSQRVTATVKGPSEVEAAGFPLARENSRPSGIWSDGQTAWVADLDDARLYAYRRSDGEREQERDIATEPAPMGLWSDGETLWVAGLGGGLRAHRLEDGTRQAWRDLALEANKAPAGVWSDGETAWVADWLGDTVHAYRLSDGLRVADREIKLDGGNLLPVGLWSDGETLWVADWREWVYAYRLSDGGRDPARDVVAGKADTDPTGLWSSGEILLATGWEDGEVRAYRVPAAAPPAQGKDQSGGLPARRASLPPVADPALRAAIEAALGKELGEEVSGEELARMESLEARNAGIRDLSGLEQAVSLKELDLGFNPLTDLRPLAALPALESLNLDGAATDLRVLATLGHLQRLSLRHNGLDDLWPLAGLTSLAELNVGDNHISDLHPLAGLGGLAVLRADRNRITDLWPLASLAGLEALELGANRVQDLQPLSGLARLQTLRLDGNGLAELHPLAGLKALRDLDLAGNVIEDLQALSDLGGLRRLDLRGNPVGNLRPLRALESLAWIHIGGSRIEDLGPLNGLSGLTVAGRKDREPPSVDGGSSGRAHQQ